MPLSLVSIKTFNIRCLLIVIPFMLWAANQTDSQNQ